MDGVYRMSDKDNTNTKFSSEYLKTRGYVEAVDVDGRVILKQIFKKYSDGTWTGFIHDL